MCKQRNLLIILAILFLIRLAAGWFIAERNPGFYYRNDGLEYAALSKNFGTGKGMIHPEVRWHEPPRDHAIPEAFRTPLLPFCGGIFIFAGLPSSGAFALVQALCITFSSLLIFRIVRKLVPERPAAPWIALILFTIHPLILEYSMMYSSEELFILCILAFTAALLERKYILAAAAGAAMTLTRPTGIVYLPGIMLLILILSFFDRNFSWKHACLYGICFFLLLLPYGIRNYIQFGKFSMTGFFGGYNLYVGCNVENSKAYAASSGSEFLRLQTIGWDKATRLAREQPAEHSAKPPLQDEYMREQAFREIRKMGIGNFILLVLRRARQFLSPSPTPGIHPPATFWGITLWELFLYLSAFAGIWLKRQEPVQLLSLAAIVLGGLSAHSLVHSYMRHRVPFLDPVLIIFAAVALAEVFYNFQERKNLPAIFSKKM